MANVTLTLVSPEDGDGESWYYEVSRYGEVWDGRAPTEAEALAEAEELLDRLTRLQEETGRTASRPLPDR